MTWTHSNSLALATHKCTVCQGSGLTLGRRGTLNACDCVLRGIFKVCYNRFQYYMNREKYLSKVTLEIHSGPNRRGTWGRKQEEYIADFMSIANRVLTEEENRIFRFRFLLGADWTLCCRRLKMERGPFHHAVYRIQCKLGKAFAEMTPYALYPLDEYFNPSGCREVVTSFPAKEEKVIPIRPPVKRESEMRTELKAA